MAAVMIKPLSSGSQAALSAAFNELKLASMLRKMS